MPSTKDRGVFAMCRTTSAPRPAGQLTDPVEPLLGCGRGDVENLLGAAAPRPVQPVGAEIGGDDPAGAHQVGLGDVQQAEGPRADDHDGVAGVEAFHRVGGELLDLVQAGGTGHQLGEHGHPGRQPVRNLVDEGVGPQIEVLGPAAEQVGRLGAGEGVAVALGVVAPDVAHDVGAGVAAATDDVRAHGDPVANGEPAAVELDPLRGGRCDVRDDADVLVALDDRERGVGLGRRAGVLLGLAEEGVLVGAADARHLDLHEQGPVGERGPRELLHLIASRSHQHGGLHCVGHRRPAPVRIVVPTPYARSRLPSLAGGRTKDR